MTQAKHNRSLDQDASNAGLGDVTKVWKILQAESTELSSRLGMRRKEGRTASGGGEAKPEG